MSNEIVIINKLKLDGLKFKIFKFRQSVIYGSEILYFDLKNPNPFLKAIS